jgi:hypothetical protein
MDLTVKLDTCLSPIFSSAGMLFLNMPRGGCRHRITLSMPAY